MSRNARLWYEKMQKYGTTPLRAGMASGIFPLD
jgi:hypothetical protein